MTIPPQNWKERDYLSKNNKEFLYVGHYYDMSDNYILKIGTTNNLERRAKEHTRNYKKSDNYTMPPESSFIYDWWLPLSKYNTLRYEDSNRSRWIEENVGQFRRNDRFVCEQKPSSVIVKIRKEYTVILK